MGRRAKTAFTKFITKSAALPPDWVEAMAACATANNRTFSTEMRLLLEEILILKKLIPHPKDRPDVVRPISPAAALSRPTNGFGEFKPSAAAREYRPPPHDDLRRIPAVQLAAFRDVYVPPPGEELPPVAAPVEYPPPVEVELASYDVFAPAAGYQPSVTVPTRQPSPIDALGED